MDDTYKIKVNEISPFPIRIARQGEANYRRLEIDVSAWLAEYPLGTVSGIFVRADGTSYPVVLTITDGIASWSPTATETTAAGAAQLVLQITSGSVIGRSATIGLRVVESPAAGATPPAVDSPWISAVIDAAATYPYVGSNGHWFTFDGESGLWVDTGVSARGTAGKGIQSIAKTDTAGKVDTYTITFTDGTTTSYTVTNGNDGITPDMSAYRTSAAQDVIDAGKADTDSVAGDYSDITFPVSAGKLCTYNSKLYKANQTIGTSEPWTAAHWDETSIEDEFARTGAVTVTITATDSTSPSGEVSVQLLQGDTVIETKAYTGQPVLFEGLVSGVEYTVRPAGTWTGKYDPNPANYSFMASHATTAVTISYSLISQISTLAQLAEVIREGYASQLTIGQQITVPWTDTTTDTSYQVPCDIVDYRAANDTDSPIVDENNIAHEGVRIQWHYITPFNIQFDAAEKVAATEATAAANMYYYGKSGTTYTLLQLSAGDTIPYGSYDAVYKNEIQDTSCGIVKNGYNRYRDSALRQFLCSEEGVGEWWAATHVGDAAPSQLNSRAGFLSGFSAADLALMKKSKITCYTNNVTDGSVIDTMYDKWHLASGTAMYGSVNANEGTFFPYWKAATGLASPNNNANSGRISYSLSDHASPIWHILRSPSQKGSSGVWVVTVNGNVSVFYAYDASGALPVCAIY